MAYRVYRTLIASLGAAALVFAASETSARSGAAHHGGVRSAHSISRAAMAHSLRHHRRNDAQAFWPAVGDPFYGRSNGEPLADGAHPGPGDIRYTTTYDVPWDWAHRYPPAVIPSDRPYVPSCPSETVTVPGRNGEPQTVGVMRCY
jgi:hypothetical protein